MFSPPLEYKELYKHTRLLPIPGAINDYNHHIDRVDIADQLWAGFSTQQRGLKPWRPLFYWLLDTTIINTFCLSEHKRKAKLDSTKDKVCSTHRAFQEALVSDLLLDPQPSIETTAYKAPKVKQNTWLPAIRLTWPIGIHFQIKSHRLTCLFCRWNNQQSSNKKCQAITKITKLGLPNRTHTICRHCRVPLCTNCFIVFHYYIDN
jgi:hypothetical protein